MEQIKEDALPGVLFFRTMRFRIKRALASAGYFFLSEITTGSSKSAKIVLMTAVTAIRPISSILPKSMRNPPNHGKLMFQPGCFHLYRFGKKDAAPLTTLPPICGERRSSVWPSIAHKRLSAVKFYIRAEKLYSKDMKTKQKD